VPGSGVAVSTGGGGGGGGSEGPIGDGTIFVPFTSEMKYVTFLIKYAWLCVSTAVEVRRT
jgi:hypothetical protein